METEEEIKLKNVKDAIRNIAPEKWTYNKGNFESGRHSNYTTRLNGKEIKLVVLRFRCDPYIIIDDDIKLFDDYRWWPLLSDLNEYRISQEEKIKNQKINAIHDLIVKS